MPRKKPAKKRSKPATEKDQASRAQAAILSIQQVMGGDAVYMANSAPAVQADAVPTGHYGFDQDAMTGFGGIPVGRIIEVYGGESSGKCLVADTYMATPGGLMTIAEIFESAGVSASRLPRVVKRRADLINRDGQPEKTVHFTCNGRRDLIQIETSSGVRIRCTANHPLLVMSEMGNWVWRRAKEIGRHDNLVLLRGWRRDDSACGSVFESESEAYAFGVLIADGYFGRTSISVTNDDPVVMSCIRRSLPKMIGAPVKEYPTGNATGSVQFRFNGKDAVQAFYRRFGLAPGVAKDKVLPLAVRCAPGGHVRAVLRGYLDCEGHASRRGLEVTSASEALLRQTKMLLQEHGIIARLARKNVHTYPDNSYWRLSITGGEAVRYADAIFSRRPSVIEAFEDYRRAKRNTNVDSVPWCVGLLRDLRDASETSREHDAVIGRACRRWDARVTYDHLDRILGLKWADCPPLRRLREIAEADYFYDPVEDASPVIGVREPTFDFEMRRTHSFIAEGVVSHNTTLALTFVRAVQEKGGVAAFIDAEHAYDPNWAANLGVRPETLVFSQPDTGEQALQIVESLVDNRAADIIVVDSVAALVPQAELEGDVGDVHVGLQARMMSQALRKLAGKIRQARTTIVFINQIREKVGLTFGPSETTPGGRALKFYASVRIEVRHGQMIKRGEQIVGRLAYLTVRKNKVSAPYGKTELAIYFDPSSKRYGISLFDSMLAHAVETGVVVRNGSWLAFDEQQFNGTEQFRIAYDADAQFRTRLHDQVAAVSLDASALPDQNR